MQQTSRAAVVFLASLAFWQAASGNDADGIQETLSEATSDNFLLQVAAVLGESHRGAFLKFAETEMPDMELSLAPIAAVLPRNAQGKFDPSAVKYGLHHHFARRHGWHLKGLDPAGEAWNTSLVTDFVAFQHIPAAVRSVVESRLTDVGFNDYDLAVFGVFLKCAVHVEARLRMAAVYKMYDVEGKDTLNHKSAALLIDAYMAAYLLRDHPSTLTRSRMMTRLRNMHKVYPYWPETQTWTRKLFSSAQHEFSSDPHGRVGLDTIGRTIELIEDQYGVYFKKECLITKGLLLPLEYQGTGRVRLSDFYSSTMNGTWQFAERVDYLRELGALDETEPKNPFVIIPNYYNGHSNCLGATALHDMCCISECEALIESIETKCQAPAASADDLAALIATLPSSTVPADRELSPLLLHRLRSIANARDDGLVPIYGRLFAQWMHHAYPRECNYPHLAGLTHPKNPTEWEGHTQTSLASPQAEKGNFAFMKHRRNEPLHSTPWDQTEELPAATRVGPPVAWVAIQLSASLAAFLVLAARMARTVLRAGRRLKSGKDGTQQQGKDGTTEQDLFHI